MKRRFDATNTDPATGVPVNMEGKFELRCLIGKYDASVIIGKGGDNVKNIREQTSCWVSVKRTTVDTIKERILSVIGLPENIARAMFMVSQLLVEASSQSRAKKGEDSTPGDITLKILIHKFIAGCILGKGGSIVKEIMDTTKARVALSTECLPGSTEKAISITGSSEALHAAVERVVSQMVATPLRPGTAAVPYVPNMFGAPAISAYAAAPAGNFAPGNYGGPPAAYVGGDQGVKTEKIVIPSVCGSMVIGRGGSVIKDIKAQSGTQISLQKPSPEALDQIVSITGTTQGIQAAVYLIRQRVDSYQPPPQLQQQQQQQQVSA